MRTSNAIIGFVLASAAIHAGVIMVADEPDTSIVLPGQTGSMLAVRIIAEKKLAPVPIKKPLYKNSKQPEKVLQKKTSTSNNKAARPNKQPQTALPAENATTQANNQQAQAKVVSLLINELRQYFVYPRLARKRNWQGKVLLAMQITPAGTVRNIRLTKSSGYPILDQAALKAMQQVETLPAMKNILQTDLDIEIPVLYQLIEG